MLWKEKKTDLHIKKGPFMNVSYTTLFLVFPPTCTFNQGLKLLFHAGASRAVTAEDLHPEEVGCPRGQLTDLYEVLLK